MRLARTSILVGLAIACLGTWWTVAELQAPPTRAAAAAEERRLVDELSDDGTSVAIAHVDHRDALGLATGLGLIAVGGSLAGIAYRRHRTP